MRELLVSRFKGCMHGKFADKGRCGLNANLRLGQKSNTKNFVLKLPLSIEVTQ